MLNIIMYHYIRNNEEFAYSCFARRKNEFEKQIEFFSKKSKILNPKDTDEIKFFLSNTDENAFLLTFDDGYKDHLYCAKYLSANNISAIFFPPINILKRELLDVNAIHYLIGQKDFNLKILLDFIIKKIKLNNLVVRINNENTTIEKYLEQTYEDRYGSKIELLFIKKLLQKDIVGYLNRKNILREAILYFTNRDTRELVDDFYLSIKNMLFMKEIGMLFGSHGLTHQWLEKLSYNEQLKEINESFNELIHLKLLDINSPKFFCYPYGSYNDTTLKIIENLNISFGLTTKVGAALQLKNNSLAELKRWNTNDCWDKNSNKPILPY